MADKAQAKKNVKKKDDTAMVDPRAIASREAEKEIALLGSPPPHPDDDTYEAKRADLSSRITTVQNSIKELQDIINEKSGGKDEAQTRRQILIERRQEISAEITSINGDKEKLKSQREELFNQGTNKSNEFKKLKDEVTVNSLDELEERIKEITKKMQMTSMTLKEEKLCIQEIANLKKMKPKFDAMEKKKAEVGAMKDKKDKVLTDLKEQTKSLVDKLSELFEERKKLDEELNAMRALDEEKRSRLDTEFKKRDKLREEKDTLIAERKQLQDEYSEKYNAYKDFERKKWEIRKRKEAEQWAIVDAKRKKEALEMKKDKAKENPYLKEMVLVDQTIKYCKGLLGEDKKEEEEEKKEEKDLTAEAPKGAKVLINKRNRDEEFFWAPTKSNKTKKKTGNKKVGPIKHNPKTFELFQDLKMDAPTTTADVPAILDKLQSMFGDYENRVKEWQQQQEQEIAKEAEADAGDDEKDEKDE